jgi:hyperosmotically inducible protein
MNAIRRNILPLLALLAVFVMSAPVSLADRRTPNSAVNNQQLVKKIRKELVTLPYYGVFDNLAFEVNGGTVTLYGQVVRPTTKSDAEHRVARLSGVTRVINRINVLPLSSFDDSIRLRTYRELVRTGSLYRYFQGANPSIHIVVDRGRVTLEGVVANTMDAQLAYMAARRVPGSFAVANHLTIEERASRRIAV